MDVGTLVRLLGGGQEHPLVALRYRSVLTTQHAVESGDKWRWGVQPADGDETAVMLVASVPFTVLSADGPMREVAPGLLCFLHPHRDVRITTLGSGSVMCAWVPWSALSEIESGVRAPDELVPTSPLARGLQAFLASLLTQPADATPYTNYFVERLIAEMVFGILVEAAPRTSLESRKAPSVDRARSLMLMRRADPDFDVAALARDMHMSSRQLQRIFAAQDSSAADELRRLRVDLSLELMGDADFAPLGIAEIAVHAGFSGAAQMRHAFSLAGLPSPAKMRSQALL